MRISTVSADGRKKSCIAARVVVVTMMLILVSDDAQAVLTPDSVPGLSLWLDAGQGVTTDGGGQVLQWNDQTDGSNNTVAQNVAVNGANPGPQFVASGIGGLPSLSFDGPGAPSGGTGNYTRLENLTDNLLASGSARTIIIIGDANHPTDPGPLFTFRRDSGGTYFRAGLVGFAGDIYAYGDPANAARFNSNPSATIQSPFLILYESSGAGALLEAELNGTSQSLTQAGTVSAETGGTGFAIGAVGLNAATWNGLIAEVLVYDRVLSTWEINLLGSSLGEKYGIATTYFPEPAGALTAVAAGWILFASRSRSRSRSRRQRKLL